ncbi:hypothetical protein Hanom_Chr06g00493561 [Helianthus anomalus]
MGSDDMSMCSIDIPLMELLVISMAERMRPWWKDALRREPQMAVTLMGLGDEGDSMLICYPKEETLVDYIK